jgi:hypothetical protein
LKTDPACASKQTEISWPQAQATQQAPTIYQHNDANDADEKLDVVPVTIASVTVPAGTYNFRAVVSVQGFDTFGVECDIPGVNEHDQDVTSSGQIIVEGAGTVAAGTVVVECHATTVGLATATLTAEPVNLVAQ